MTTLRERVTIAVARPDQVVRLLWVEVQHLQPERVRRGRCRKRVPRAPVVGRIVERVALRDQVGAVLGEGVVVEGEELFFRVDLIPGIALVAGLPDGVVGQAYKDSLQLT